MIDTIENIKGAPDLIVEILAYDWAHETQIHYFYDEEEKENFIPVAIFGGDLKLDLKYIFGN